jgi:hypothetical protein
MRTKPNSRAARDWVERFEDRFWLKPDEMGAEEARFVKRALGLRKGRRALDAPCGAGLTVERLYGGIDGRPYRKSSRRLIVVGRKKGTTS